MSLIAELYWPAANHRMGEDKARCASATAACLQELRQGFTASKPLAINANRGHPIPAGAVLIGDTIGGQPGPLAGILAGLEWAAELHPKTGSRRLVPGRCTVFPGGIGEAPC